MTIFRSSPPESGENYRATIARHRDHGGNGPCRDLASIRRWRGRASRVSSGLGPRRVRGRGSGERAGRGAHDLDCFFARHPADVGEPHECLDAERRADGEHEPAKLRFGHPLGQWRQCILDPADNSSLAQRQSEPRASNWSARRLLPPPSKRLPPRRPNAQAHAARCPWSWHESSSRRRGARRILPIAVR